MLGIKPKLNALMTWYCGRQLKQSVPFFFLSVSLTFTCLEELDGFLATREELLEFIHPSHHLGHVGPHFHILV